MKKNMLRLLTTLTIVSLLYGSFELNAMRGWWNNARNTARAWWNKPYVQEGIRPIGVLTVESSGSEFATDVAHEQNRRFLEAKEKGLPEPEAWEESRKPGFINLGLEGRQRRKIAEKVKEKESAKYQEFIGRHIND